MGYQTVILERQGNLATITMNRPEVLNAINRQLREDIHSALDEVAVDSEIRVVILTGAGRGFCSGADVTQMRGRAEGNAEAIQSASEQTVAAAMRGEVAIPIHVRRMPQPVIAAVNGVASGMGMGIALSCDIRVASDQARFASIFIKRSIMPDNGVTQTLSKQVPLGIAMEMALTGNIYDAKWAMERGLVNYVVPHDSLMEEARTIADTIAANPPLAVRLTRQAMYKNYFAELERAIDKESLDNNTLSVSEDRKEAVLSFLEKRRPVFKGR
ncbi:MAG: short chain enoyl-CoA hydratase [Dehalococcoidia bacterium]|nr:short chain enoyl-CoA hydratase [Dehalococcoidia bacterium]